jgi:hypothetical protein
MMRATLIITILFATLLGACSTNKDRIGNKNIDQTSTLKVNPGLLGGSAAPGANKTEPTPERK